VLIRRICHKSPNAINKLMKLNKILPLMLLLACSMSFAQPGKKNVKKLNTKKVQVVDSIKVSKIAEELPSTVVATGIKDTIIFDLKDMALARKKDSLWLKELYKSDLFEDV